MKFGYAWTSGEAPAPPGKANPGIAAPAGLPAKSELGRLTPTGLFLLVGGFRIRLGILEWRSGPKQTIPEAFAGEAKTVCAIFAVASAVPWQTAARVVLLKD
jgi:hypothetical protein